MDLPRNIRVVVRPPSIPVTSAQLPAGGTGVVVPVPGKPGPPGAPGASGAGHIHTQTNPATVWTIDHGLLRDLVLVTVYSLDFQTQWSEVTVQPISNSRCRISFDDPQTGVAYIG